MINLGNQFVHASKGATADRLLRDQSEKAFHLIQPGSIRGREMDLPTRMAGEPGLDRKVRARPWIAISSAGAFIACCARLADKLSQDARAVFGSLLLHRANWCKRMRRDDTASGMLQL